MGEGLSLPPSPHFVPLDLEGVFDTERGRLPPALRPPALGCFLGSRSIRGVPFLFGSPDRSNVVHLRPGGPAADVPLTLPGVRFVVLAHVVEDVETPTPGVASAAVVDGGTFAAGSVVYRWRFADGSSVDVPVHRRFGIQQARCGWGASATAAVPARDDIVRRRVGDAVATGGSASWAFGAGEVGVVSGRDAAFKEDGLERTELLWLYAMPNPHPERPLAGLELRPGREAAAVYAASATSLAEHPLRPALRRTFRVRVDTPATVTVDAVGDALGSVAVDLGHVLSARTALRYDPTAWLGDGATALPVPATDELLVEVAAHPAARLAVGPADAAVVHDLAAPGTGVVEIPPAERPVRIRIVERGTGTAVAARLHLHGDAGEYLPPRGHHRRVNTGWFEDLYAELAVGRHESAYVEGQCVVDVPLGPVHVEIVRGFEFAPVRRTVLIEEGTDELVFELDRVLHWRERGWVTADTHVHFLSPQTALLEGRAEGVNVVNLLASQWGRMFSNVGDFDGRTTFGARDFGGDGEFLVRVGSENRMQVLGHISLLGYAGELIHPLCTGGPSESAPGDPLAVSMAEWARACRAQGGLVVLPHAPQPQLERAANLVLGDVDAVELMVMNPLVNRGGLSAYGIADWYRYLNLGYATPLVGGSDKMSAASLLGGVRTYARLREEELSYEAWMRAVRSGDTFVTVGPLVSMSVEGVRPGGRIDLPAGGGTVAVVWEVESVAVRVERVEIVAGGLVVGDVEVGGLASSGSTEVHVSASTWIAVRVRGSHHGDPLDVAAHTSAVTVLVGGTPPWSEADAAEVLDQIEGAIAYVDTLAPRPTARRLRELRATLEGAYGRLHARLHREGTYHRHPLHDPAEPHEH